MKTLKNFFILLSVVVIPANLVNAQLPPGTKGTLKLDVEVQDELGLDTVSQVVKLENIKPK
ncbi:MAG: hypothetical protein AUJ85_10175 [Elusimicrobia bacterium CG1_02_37_114]|nr:MAG: hypothetical protein AUJ85_10175 [Elusimicrobia bacterium CG1_02_37_114]PIV52438.1 MAG: hypothetical protein COS17_09145 [Elusimicrobia bacterium CG02_land_8_20_14_3_00_37_13]PIZ14132.1 MAG: hypothetical protein COY53_01190 [Elusimicrobia bacterium CG_4_10_14_0_8_um_filter_37_32]